MLVEIFRPFASYAFLRRTITRTMERTTSFFREDLFREFASSPSRKDGRRRRRRALRFGAMGLFSYDGEETLGEGDLEEEIDTTSVCALATTGARCMWHARSSSLQPIETKNVPLIDPNRLLISIEPFSSGDDGVLDVQLAHSFERRRHGLGFFAR